MSINMNGVVARMPRIITPFGFDGSLIGHKSITDTGVLAKPKMRGLLAAQIKRNLFVGTCLSIAGGLAFKIFVADVRKERYREFYSNYDAEAVCEDIRRKGYFQSC